MGNQEYIEKWLSDQLSEEEKLMFERTEEYQSLARLSRELESFKAPEFDVHSEFNRLKGTRNSRKAEKVVSMAWLQPLLRVAAVLLILTVGGYFAFFWNSTVTVNTLASEKTELYLPDSSSVALNSLSTLTYKANRWTSRRAVELDGEAFFRVAKGARFDVETASGVISVLGTQFNVKAREDYFEVVCYEGLVEVKYADHVVKLPPAKMFRVVKGIIVHEEDAHEVSPSWISNESSFESVPFGEVIEEFERQYNVNIIARNIDLNQLFTGRFVHSDFSLAIKSISIPLNLKYEVEDDQENIVLSGENR